MSEYLWTTREGQQLTLDQIDNRHLANILKMLLRNAERIRMESLCQMGSPPTAEMAEYYFEQAQTALTEAEPEELIEQLYPELTAEAERRGIDWTKTEKTP
jgi:hypothetical protein